MDTRRDEYNSTAAEKSSKTSSSYTFMCVLSNSASLFCQLAASLFLSFAVHYLSLLCLCISVCIRVKPVAGLWRPCVYRCDWSLWIMRLSVCITRAHVCLCARQMLSDDANAQHSNTHMHTRRKINQHFIHPFASWICPNLPPKHPHSPCPLKSLVAKNTAGKAKESVKLELGDSFAPRYFKMTYFSRSGPWVWF